MALIVALLYSYAGRLTEFHYMYLLPSPLLDAPAENLTVPRYDVSSRNCTSVSQWVVTTSDTKTPSVAVQVLLNSTNDWCVLVLGERRGLGYDFPWTARTKHLIYMYLPFEALPFLPFKIVILPVYWFVWARFRIDKLLNYFYKHNFFSSYLWCLY